MTMTYRRAVIPALVGGVLLTALLRYAGASVHALELPGADGVLGGQTAVGLQQWLAPWAYDPPASLQYGDRYRVFSQCIGLQDSVEKGVIRAVRP
uniref:Uncharacterized protein n=1 Tax=Streptomyces sp. NBC_00180 TaxID=2903632 RepID=A0AAU1HQW2_9ACTN